MPSPEVDQMLWGGWTAEMVTEFLDQGDFEYQSRKEDIGILGKSVQLPDGVDTR